MPESITYLLILFFLLTIGLLVALSALAFSDPQGFLSLVPGGDWIFDQLDRRRRYLAFFSYTWGIVLLTLCLLVSFVFGALTFTFGLGLWTSPIIQLLERL